MRTMVSSLILFIMADYTEHGGRLGQSIALWAIVAVVLVVLAIWLCNKTGQDKADLAASVQKLYGHVECITPQLNKYADRVDAIGNAVTRVSQAQADFQSYASSMITDLDNAVFVPRFAGHHGGCGCGTDKFVKSTEYTAGATTLVETDVCRS